MRNIERGHLLTFFSTKERKQALIVKSPDIPAQSSSIIKNSDKPLIATTKTFCRITLLSLSWPSCAVGRRQCRVRLQYGKPTIGAELCGEWEE